MFRSKLTGTPNSINVILLLFFFSLSSSCLLAFSMRSTCRVDGQGLQCFKFDSGVSHGPAPSFFLHKLTNTCELDLSWHLGPTCEVRLVISHVEHGEPSIGQCTHLFIVWERAIGSLLSLLQVCDIHESGIVLIDSYIRDEFLEVTKRDFIHVGQ